MAIMQRRFSVNCLLLCFAGEIYQGQNSCPLLPLLQKKMPAVCVIVNRGDLSIDLWIILRYVTEHISFSIDDEKFELCTINPGLILGPVLHGSKCTSMEVNIN